MLGFPKDRACKHEGLWERETWKNNTNRLKGAVLQPDSGIYLTIEKEVKRPGTLQPP